MRIELIGWALLHSLWQGGVVALLFWGALRVVRPTAPRARYVLGLLALVVLLALPVLNYRESVGLWEGHRAWLVETAEHIVRDQLVSAGSASAAEVGEELRRRHAAVWAQQGAAAGVAEALHPSVRLVAWLWLAGVMVFGLRLRAAMRRARRLREGGSVDPRWHAASRRVAARIGLDRRVRVRVTPRIDVPALVGWRWPVVLVPPSARALPDAEVEAILAHELAHVARHDYLTNLLQNIADVLLFYSPAAWWISSAVREERECSCDQSAIPAVQGGPARYLRALVELEDARPARSPLLALNAGPLIRRIRRVHAATRDTRVIDRPNAFALGLLAAALFAADPDPQVPIAARLSTTQLMQQDLDGLRMVVQAVPVRHQPFQLQPIDPEFCPESSPRGRREA